MTLFGPIAQKVYLDLKGPSPEDNISDIDPKRIRFVGNGSLMGARLALLSTHAFE